VQVSLLLCYLSRNLTSRSRSSAIERKWQHRGLKVAQEQTEAGGNFQLLSELVCVLWFSTSASTEAYVSNPVLKTLFVSCLLAVF
jgi:hypothetical protein